MGNSNNNQPDREEIPVRRNVSNTPEKPNNLPLVRAIYNYVATGPDNLSFVEGDLLQILPGQLSDEHWYYAELVRTKQVGFIPRSYVMQNSIDITTSKCFVDVDHQEARQLLIQPHLHDGTFLVRKAASSEGCYALSVRCHNADNGKVTVNHYVIRKSVQNYYIASYRQFKSVDELIKHYQEKVDGLCCLLSKPFDNEPQLVPFEQLEVDKETITFDKKLGFGNFGEVWAARCRDVGPVAVKILKKSKVADTTNSFLAEAHRMHGLSHRHLVTLLGVCVLPNDSVYILMELMVNGALDKFLQQNIGNLPLDNRLEMARQVADGMAYLEMKCFIHRDLRAANILVGRDLTMKVSDFGMARKLQCTNGDYHITGGTPFPIRWTAPEAARKLVFTIKSDVWSFGLLLYEIITYGRIPYADMTKLQVVTNICSGYRIPRPHGDHIECPQHIYELMLECWHAEPSQRPSFKQVFQFFDKLLSNNM